jgi:lipopolysaccharide transport system ATP-binding protein
VAAHLEPEILIVDEVLAVGDAEFQKKCLGKMHEVSRGGRTVLFVSHNMGAIQTLCNRAVWLNKGEVQFDGAVDEAVNTYLASASSGSRVDQNRVEPLTPALDLTRFELVPATIESGAGLEFKLTVTARETTVLRHITLLLYSLQEQRLAIVDLRAAGFPRTVTAGESSSINGWITSVPLVEGEYRVGLGFSTDDHFEDKLGLVDLTVTPRPATTGVVPYASQFRGVVELDFGLEA